MWVTEMNNNGPMTNGFVQLNHDSQDDYKGTRDEAMAKGHELFEEHESRIDENNNEDADCEHRLLFVHFFFLKCFDEVERDC